MFPHQEHDADSDAAHPTVDVTKLQAQETRTDGVLSSDEASNVKVTSNLLQPPDGGWQAWLCSISPSTINQSLN